MSKLIQQVYQNELIDFLLQKNLKFFTIHLTYASVYRSSREFIVAYPSKEDIKINEPYVSLNIRELTDINDIKKKFNTYNLVIQEQLIREEFFYLFFNKNPKYQKELLVNNHKYFSVYLNKNFEKFIEKTTSNKNETIKTILNFPISFFKVEHVNLNKLQEKLKEIGYTHEERLNFWFKFFKDREKQIKLVANSKKVCDFLTYHYEYSELEQFFPFFSYLQAKYEDIPLNIFDSDYRISTSIFLNIKKMHGSFSLDGWNFQYYETALEKFSKAIKEHYELEESNFSAINRAKKSFAIVFFHNKESFNQEKLKQLVGDFFNSLKRNPKKIEEITQEFLKSWLQQNDLQKSLSKKNEGSSKMKKI